MRGVYQVPHPVSSPPRGSSPHARGLLLPATASTWTGGIIPACAGFTSCSPTAPSSPRDHPRMRGVYRGGRSRSDDSSGSSPHARGLRPVDRLGHDQQGIIPACAGFTTERKALIMLIRDHPRMRGVYARFEGGPPDSGGSSPHARGLRQRVRGGDGPVGIIPACAGFTHGRAHG